KEINNSEVDDRLELEYSLKELLKKYIVDDVEKLQEILFKLFIQNRYKYDRKFHFDLDFVNRWYEMNIWSHLIDPAFYNVNIDLIRSEGMSFASSDRKKVERMTSDRKKVGRKGDGVFRLHKDHLEFGAIEAGRDWEGQCESKIIADSLKILGMLQSRNRMQVITADFSKEYVTRIRRRKVCEVSAHLTKSKPLALVLKEIFYVKNIILRTFDIINRKDDIDIETFHNNSDEEKYRTPPRKIISNILSQQNIEESSTVSTPTEVAKLKCDILEIKLQTRVNTDEHVASPIEVISQSDEKKDINSDLLSEVEHSSTQSESLTESKISTTSLPEDIDMLANADDDSAETLEFVERVYKKNVSNKIKQRNGKKKLLHEIHLHMNENLYDSISLANITTNNSIQKDSRIEMQKFIQELSLEFDLESIEVTNRNREQGILDNIENEAIELARMY
ncbi:6273_t:CDS:2, partial [Scutellospora calospora]